MPPTSVPCFSRFWNWGQNSRRRIHLSFSGSVSPGSSDPCAKADVSYGACHQLSPASLPATSLAIRQWPATTAEDTMRSAGASHPPPPAQSPQLCPSVCLSLPDPTSAKGCFANGSTGSHEGRVRIEAVEGEQGGARDSGSGWGSVCREHAEALQEGQRYLLSHGCHTHL